MNDTQTLILAGTGYELTVAPEAEAQKAELLKHAALIVQVNDPQDNEAARHQVKALAAMRNAVEKSRNTVKAPVLQVGRDIDAKAKEFVEAIDAEEKRLGKLMADYATEVEALRRKMMREIEEKRREEENARIMAEAARIKAEQEAEAARIAAEKAMWEEPDDRSIEEQAGVEYQKAKAAAEALRQAEAEEAARKAQDKVVAIVPAKAEGVKFTADYELEDIDALYRYSPALVTMEPKRKDILELIRALGADEDNQIIPGIKITKRAVVAPR